WRSEFSAGGALAGAVAREGLTADAEPDSADRGEIESGLFVKVRPGLWPTACSSARLSENPRRTEACFSELDYNSIRIDLGIPVYAGLAGRLLQVFYQGCRRRS